MLLDNSPVELFCGHEVCARCVLKQSSCEDFDVNCQNCKSP